MPRGKWAIAWGKRTIAWGEWAIAWGEWAIAWGEWATAWGKRTMAWGKWTIARGKLAIAWGKSTMAWGRWTIAWGESMVRLAPESPMGAGYQVRLHESPKTSARLVARAKRSPHCNRRSGSAAKIRFRVAGPTGPNRVLSRRNSISACPCWRPCC